MFEPLENTTPFLKMAFEGFAGDGKTFTATQIAIGLHKMIGSKKPIALLDTEKASKALLEEFENANIKAVVNKGRSLTNLNAAIKWCEQGGADILIIDSITHVWEEFLEAYKASKEKNRNRLTFEDWGIIKPRWKREFSTPFVEANVHIIFTGRAGYEYDIEKTTDDRGYAKTEIHKSGIKMKAEGETAFEPDILILMEKDFELLGDVKKLVRNATILKDRTNTIDGETFINPTFDNLLPAIKKLLHGVVKSSKVTESKDQFDSGAAFEESKKQRDICYEEIKGLFDRMLLGTGKEEKAYKAGIIDKLYGTSSLEGLQNISLVVLQDGIKKLKSVTDQYCKKLEEWSEKGLTPDIMEIKNLLYKELGDDLPM